MGIDRWDSGRWKYIYGDLRNKKREYGMRIF